MAKSPNRILTTHVGSLPRPLNLLDMMKAKLAGGHIDPAAYNRTVRKAVVDIVKQQKKSGIDIVADGEQSKPGFFSYVRERLDGFEPRPGMKFHMFAAELKSFPDYYAQYFKDAMLGGTVAPFAPLVCTGPVSYRDLKPLERDIANLKAAMAASGATDAFMPAIGPSGVGVNEYYKNEEEYFYAVGAAMRTEYKAIVDAGLTLQVDDPFLCDMLIDPALTPKQKDRTAWMYIDAINESIKGLPEDKVRFHTCYSINEGPRIHDVPLDTAFKYVLKVNAGAYSFEYANPRHEHEYHMWENVKLPDGKKLIPGMVMHAVNIVEHPQLIAERLMRFANLVGRDNVIAGCDCGFSSQATYRTEVHPTVMWAKFQAMREGADIATKLLWKKRAAAKAAATPKATPRATPTSPAKPAAKTKAKSKAKAKARAK